MLKRPKADMRTRWVPKLGQLLAANGLDVRVEHRRPWESTDMVHNHDSTLMVWEEMRSKMDPASAQEYGKILDAAEKARQDAGGRVCMNLDRWTFVAQKPS